MERIPFLRPKLAPIEKCMPYFKLIDNNRIYSNFGPINVQFEKKVMHEIFHDTGEVCTANNATTGLILAIHHMKRPTGKYAVMPSFTFAATPLAAIWNGLEPYFVDINPDDWCMDTQLLNEVIEKHGEEIAVIVPYAAFGTAMNLSYYEQLHLAGWPVVIDAAASFGTLNGNNEQFGTRFPGSVVYSFHATKTFGIGEGALIYSANTDAIRKIQSLENFGFQDSNKQSLNYGLNGKLSEIMAAVAMVTLEEFPDKKRRRESLRSIYNQHLLQTSLLSKGWVFQETEGEVAWQSLPLLCEPGKRSWDIASKLLEEGIETRAYFSPPCHEHPVFSACRRTSMKVTEDVASRIICLPFFEDLSEIEAARVVQSLERIANTI